MNLSGKVAFITGGASGIGFAIAKVLAERGAQVAIGQRSLEQTKEAAARLHGLGVEIDISKWKSVELAIATIVRECGGIDILVNNASVTGRKALEPLLSCPAEATDRIVDTNLKGTVYCSQLAARYMVSTNRRGSIIHITSVGAYAAQEHGAVYCATKAAQVSLAQGMALEWAPYGIRVNCVAPGDIRTETSERAVEEIHESGATGKYIRVTPLGRRGTPEEVGKAVAFLASDDASFITGTTLLVDGGFLAY